MRKQLLILGTLLLLVIASSCSKDDNHTDPIVGTWELRDTDENYILYVRLTFNSNQTGEVYVTETENEEENDEYEYIEQFTYSISGDKLTVTTKEDTDVFKYSISGNKLSIFYKDELDYDEAEVYTRKN